jgi:hypothetical protein
LNNKIRKETQIKFYNALAVSMLIKVRNMDYKKNIETAEMKFLRNVAGYTRNDQMRRTKIREELSIFNLNAKIIKSRSQRKYHVRRMEDRRTAKKILTYNPKRKRNTVKMEGSVYSSRGRSRPRMA